MKINWDMLAGLFFFGIVLGAVLEPAKEIVATPPEPPAHKRKRQKKAPPAPPPPPPAPAPAPTPSPAPTS